MKKLILFLDKMNIGVIKMNIKKGFIKIKKLHEDIDFEIDNKDDESIEFRSNVEFEKYKGGVSIKCICFDSGTIHVFFILDKLKNTLDDYEAINKFNRNESFLRAYINQNNYLEFHYSSKFYDTDDMVEEFEYAFNRFSDDDETYRQIKNLSYMTYNEEEEKRIISEMN